MSRELTDLMMPDEVVTDSYVQFLTLKDVPGQVALITLDNGRDHSRPSTLGPETMRRLDAALDTAFAAQPAAIAITGKPFIFAAGADLSGIGALQTYDDAFAVAHLGHQVLRRLRETSVPTFSFINGAAFGGGLEIGLHCHYRTLSSSAAAVALPECFLGILPGWGGATLLPKIAGPANAVTVIIENALSQNRVMRPADALRLGVVDVVLDAADYLEQSLAWLAGVLRGEITVERPSYSPEAFAQAVADGRQFADFKTKGATRAPYAALDIIEAASGNSLHDGFAAEDTALAELMCSEQFRAGLYAFHLVQKRARKPVGAPDLAQARRVTKVGVVGAGLMAGQLALLFARRAKVPVVMTDLDQERLDKGIAYVHGEIAKLAAKKRISPDTANQLTALVTGSLDMQAFSDADFVIEAVFEELDLKKQIFAKLEQAVRPDCILASNTSSLSVTGMADGLAHPERVIGFHFFNPVAVMPLLEIVVPDSTDTATAATAFALAKTLGKSAIRVADRTGFVVNRLLLKFMSEILAAIDEGTDPQVADIALDPLGLPMTPIMLLQLVGPAVALHVQEELHRSWPDRFSISENLKRVVDSGLRQLVTFDADGKQIPSDEFKALLVQGDQPSSTEQVRDRALASLAAEVRIMLDESVVAGPEEIDLGMITGAGWPFWLGGITPYLDREGVSERVTQARFLPPGVASMPS